MEKVTWTASGDPALQRAYTASGASLWLHKDGQGFIIHNGQTIWESDTAGTTDRVEAEARRLGVL